MSIELLTRRNRPPLGYRFSLNRYSKQSWGLVDWFPLQHDQRNYGRDFVLSGEAGQPDDSWSERGHHWAFNNNNFSYTGDFSFIDGNTNWTITFFARSFGNGPQDSKAFSLADGTNYIELDHGGPATPTSIDYDLSFGTFTSNTISGNFADGIWHFFSIRCPGSATSAFLVADAAESEQVAGHGTNSFSSTTTVLRIGYSVDGGNRRWEGEVSDVRIYDRYMTYDQVQEVRHNPWDLYLVERPFAMAVPVAGTDPEGPLLGGKLIRGGMLARGRLV